MPKSSETSSETFLGNVGRVLIGIGIVMFVMIIYHKVTGTGDGDTEHSKKPTTTVTAPADDDPSITKKVMSDSEHDTVVVRSRGNEYVRIGEMVFCWHSNVLAGVFTKDGLVPGWQTMTNQPPPK